MTDHAHELRRYSRKIGQPAGDVPSVMLAAADEIDRLAAMLEAAESETASWKGLATQFGQEADALRVKAESADSECLEQARLNGMGSEREAALMAKLEAAEKAVTEAYQRGYSTGREEIEAERDALRAALRHEADCVEATKAEIVTLRTKIEQMEKQEPYCWTTSPPAGHYSRFNPEVDRWIENGWTVVPLYLAPGAQPAPSLASGDVSLISEGKTQPASSIPEGWKLVPIEPTQEMLASAWGVDACDIDGTYKAMLAAAPKMEEQ